jgi:hypothetical protein
MKAEIALVAYTILCTAFIVFVLMLGIAGAKTDVLIFSGGQEPQIVKMPQFAYLGTQPLCKDDKIVSAVHYKAKGSNIYEKVIEYHEQTYLEKGWNPKFMRMLVIVQNVNKGFSTSGSVSISNTESSQENKALGTVSKYLSSNLTNSGSIAPSYYQNWTSQKFEVWFFLISE